VTPSFSGAVLVGGRSTRFGSDKALLFADGVERALRDAGATTVVRIGRADDEVPDVGPLGGIATALRRTAEDVVVVLACDLARASAASVAAVVDALGDHDVAMPPGEPLHAAWRRTALPAVLDAIATRRLAVRAALDALDVVEVPGIAPETLLNVNEPSDLGLTETDGG
jgi:molybdopterin-guanine dinucleotide biosynthesis protein A